MRVLGKSAVKVALVEPAATFTAVTPSSADGGADTLLTSTGVHGLTSAVSVGANIYISAGTGWTVGFHTITAIAVDTTGTTIQIDTPFDAGMGTPTIALANTEVTVATVSIPPLLPDSVITVWTSFSGTDTTATSKTVRVKLGSTAFYGTALTTSPFARRVTTIHNRGVTNSQIGGFATTSASGEGNTTVSPAVSTIDTSVQTSLTITIQPAAANIVESLDSYLVRVFM